MTQITTPRIDEPTDQATDHAGGRGRFLRIVRIPPHHVLPLLLLILVLAGGAYARLAGLGDANFRHDEIMMYYAGQSMQQGHGPRLPSGEMYQRGIDVTRLIGFTDRYVADPELAARLPAAMLGVLGLALFAAAAWMIAGPWPAVWGTLLLAIYPEAVSQSRQVRFYTYQLVFGIVALFGAWQVVRPGAEDAFSGPDVRRRWAWAAITILAFLLAARVQVVSLSVFAGWGVALALFGILDARRLGRQALSRSVPLQLSLLGLVAFVAMAIAAPQMMQMMRDQAMSVAGWAGSGGHPLTYYYSQVEHFPVIVSLAPVILLAAAVRNLPLTVFLTCWFAVPLFLHSFVFAWKGERFVLLALPGLYLLTGIAAAAACGALFSAVFSRSEGILPSRARRPLATGLVAMIALAAIVTTPAFNSTRKVASGEAESMLRRERWDRVSAIIGEVDPERQLPIGSTDPLAAHFYINRIDFSARQLEVRGTRGEEAELHWTTNSPVLSTPEAIRSSFGDRSSVLIAADSARWIDGRIDPALRRVLEEESEELCRRRCGSVRLFRWTFDETPPAAQAASAP